MMMITKIKSHNQNAKLARLFEKYLKHMTDTLFYLYVMVPLFLIEEEANDTNTVVTHILFKTNRKNPEPHLSEKSS